MQGEKKVVRENISTSGDDIKKWWGENFTRCGVKLSWSVRQEIFELKQKFDH